MKVLILIVLSPAFMCNQMIPSFTVKCKLLMCCHSFSLFYGFMRLLICVRARTCTLHLPLLHTDTPFPTVQEEHLTSVLFFVFLMTAMSCITCYHTGSYHLHLQCVNITFKHLWLHNIAYKRDIYSS